MRIGDGRVTKFISLTQRDLLGCTQVLAMRTQERKDDGPTEVRRLSSSARLVKAGLNPSESEGERRQSRSKECVCNSNWNLGQPKRERS